MEMQTQPDRIAGPPAAGPAIGSDASDVGAELRAARERMGVALETVAADLKIRADYLTGLERNDHAALPALAYSIGFVRSYAAYVGLEPGALARRFREEAGRPSVEQDYTWLRPIEKGRFSGSLLLTASLAIAAAAYAGWYYRTVDARKPAAAVDIVWAQRAPSGAVAAADGAGGAGSPERAGEARLSPPSQPKQDPEDGAANAQGGSIAALPEDSEVGMADGPEAAEGDRAPTPEPATGAADRPILLKALGLVWIRVRDPQTETVIVEGIMKPGNEVTVPDKPGLVLDVGRANHLEYLIGGRSAGLAGPTAAVRHNLSLDPARLFRAADAIAARDAAATESDGERAGPGNTEGGNTEGGNTEGGNTEGGNTEGGNIASASAEGEASEEPPAAAEGAIVLRALGLVWIRVRHPQTRQVLVEGIMKEGNRVAVPEDPGLVLDVGRANQLEYLVGGKPAGLAGDSPGPVHNLSLDPARLKPDG